MIKGQNIICFGSARWEYTGLQQTIMRYLSKKNRIIYINPIGTRKISFQPSHFQFYYSRLLRSFRFNHNEEISKNILVINPWIIPLVYNNMIKKINESLIRLQFARIFSKLKFRNYILWIGTPSAAFILNVFSPKLLVYNPVDRYCAFSFVNRDKIKEYEQLIATMSDIIICTSDEIKKDLLPYNKSCYIVSHGVDFDHFSSAINSEIIPDDIFGIPKPIIGFYGGLAEWVNYDLLYKISIKYPYASIVLIGKKYFNLGKLEYLRNVHLLGFKDTRELPIYLKHFDVCLIPYIINERLVAVDPIKLREYLSMGKPVVSVNLPEVRKLEDLLYIGTDEEDFIMKVGEALKEQNILLVKKRQIIAKQNDWSNKIEQISNIISSTFKINKKINNMTS